MLHDFILYLMCVLAIAGGVGLITNRNPIYCVLFLILNFFAIGGLYLTLQSEFLAVVQIIVYAGAIMVLFLFVIMLLNLSESDMEAMKFDWRRGMAFILGIGFLFEILVALGGIKQLPAAFAAPLHFQYGKVETIGNELMTRYLFHFEIISVILLSALIGAIVIAKKN